MQQRGRPNRRALIVAICGLVPAFMFTAVLDGAYKERRRRLAIEWTERGEDAIGRRNANEAVEDFLTALAYRSNDADIRLRLAEALVTARRPDEARLQLRGLHEEQPENGPINLELARLAAADGDVPTAERFYRRAVSGTWPSRGEQSRRMAEAELATLLSQPRARAR